MSRAREWMLNAVTAAVTLLALTLGGMRVYERFFPAAAQVSPTPTPVEEWRQYSLNGHRVGAVDAPVTIVEFSDYQCPYCSRAAAVVRAVGQRHANDVALVYRHMPLESHKYAMQAARASECAGTVNAFDEYHRLLFAQQDSIGSKSWDAFAKEAGVRDLGRFARCLADTTRSAAIDADLRAAELLGVDATPTFLIDSLLIRGWPGERKFTGYVEAALKRSQRR